ncbi:MAG TPA: hypothetical protein VMS93_07635 [Candidatus Saccharimonadales bacterium]|nr:hypothetical protein [Candidatus Saccharimonadales bacterium]
MGGRALALPALLASLGAGLWAPALPAPAARPAPPVSEVELAVRDVTVGTLVPVWLRVEVDRGERIEWPVLEHGWGDFEVRGVDPPRRERRPGGRVRETVQVTVASFGLGPQVLPGPVVRVVGRDSLTLRLPTALVLVRPVLAPGDKQKDIRDIKAPVPWRRPLPAWVRRAAWAAGLLALVLLAAWAVNAWLRHRREAELRLPAHVRALRDLEALRRSALLREGRYQDYHVRLTEVLRRYVGQHCGFDALDLTTEELLGRLATELPEEGEPVRRILEASDLVKFARVTPAPGSSEELLEASVQVVERTRPREAQEDAA